MGLTVDRGDYRAAERNHRDHLRAAGDDPAERQTRLVPLLGLLLFIVHRLARSAAKPAGADCLTRTRVGLPMACT